jgi:hypothetical protein
MNKYLVIMLALLLIGGSAFANGGQEAASAPSNVVTVFGAFVAQEEARFNAAIKPF